MNLWHDHHDDLDDDSQFDDAGEEDCYENDWIGLEGSWGKSANNFSWH